ncbi:MAG: hypothetical protein ACXW3L_02590 [Limisphaerales bacterium]
MERVMTMEADALFARRETEGDIETRVQRSRLINLTLDWELRALTMDAQRYKSLDQTERESLKDMANTYRNCVSELSVVLAHITVPACKDEKS